MSIIGRSDDTSIGDDEILWRRFHPTQMAPDEPIEELTASSGVFRDKEMSVHIASLTSLPIVRAKYPEHGIVSFTAAAARAEGLVVVRDPIPEDESHALVCRSDGTKITKTQAKALKLRSKPVVTPPAPLP